MRTRRSASGRRRLLRAAMAAALGFLALPGSPRGARADEALALVYAVHEPEAKSARPPLLLLLHGQGANELDLSGLWTQLPRDFVVVSPRAPLQNPSGGFRWYVKGDEASVEASRRKLIALTETVVRRYGADPSRVFVGGFSQGAVMSYQLGLTEPSRFRGVAVLSGSLFRSALRRLGPRAELSREAFFIAHGTKDARIPFAAATEDQAELKELGAPVEVHAYPGMGHEISDAEMAALAGWLARMSASPP